MKESRDAIVVGAGVAGLACARTLRDAGLDVLVVDAGDGVGGRVRSDRVDGYVLDRGFQVLPVAYPEARRALDYGRLDLRPFSRGAIVRAGGRFHRVADPRDAPLRGLRSLAGGVVRPRDVPGVLRLLRGLAAETTAADAMREAAISERLRDEFFAPFLRGVFLDPELVTSSRFLGFVLDAFSAGPAALPNDGMGAIADQLAEGVGVRLHTRVTAVGGGVAHVEAGDPLEAAAVVVATAELIDETEHGWHGVSCVYYEAPAPPIPGPWLVLDGDGDGPVNNLCVPSETAPGYAPVGRSLVSATVLGAEVDLEAVTSQLRAWFGRAFGSWRHLATVSVPRALPAFPVGAHLERAPRITRGLYACGDHREHPSLNGALASGRRAAEAVLADRV